MMTVGTLFDSKQERILFFNGMAHIAMNEKEQTDGDGTLHWHYDCVWVNVAEQTEEAVVDAARRKCLDDIDSYDTSDSVNSFYLDGKPKWLDFDTRNKVFAGNERLKIAGRTETTLWLDEDCYTMPIETAQQLLSQIETYAKDCYNVTASHKVEVQGLRTLEEIFGYDVTKDYPQKVHLSLVTDDNTNKEENEENNERK